MRKKLSLLMVALLALTAFAATQIARRAGEGTKLIDYPTAQTGITVSGSTTITTVKIHENVDAVDCIKLANGYTTDGALNANYVKLTVDGGFKTGDVVTIAGAFNNSDESKEAKVTIFTVNEGVITKLYTTGQFINGRTSSADPVAESYTLEADAAELYLGRQGGTGTNITQLTVTRPASKYTASVEVVPSDAITGITLDKTEAAEGEKVQVSGTPVVASDYDQADMVASVVYADNTEVEVTNVDEYQQAGWVGTFPAYYFTMPAQNAKMKIVFKEKDILFDNPSGWEKVYVYAYSTDASSSTYEPFGAMPGAEMTAVQDPAAGKTIYKISTRKKMPRGGLKLVFSDGKKSGEIYPDKSEPIDYDAAKTDAYTFHDRKNDEVVQANVVVDGVKLETIEVVKGDDLKYLPADNAFLSKFMGVYLSVAISGHYSNYGNFFNVWKIENNDPVSSSDYLPTMVQYKAAETDEWGAEQTIKAFFNGVTNTGLVPGYYRVKVQLQNDLIGMGYTNTVQVKETYPALWTSEDPVSCSWSGEIQIPADKLTRVKVGDKIHVAVEGVIASDNEWDAMVSLHDGVWSQLEQTVAVGRGDKDDAVFTVTGDIKKYIQQNGLMITGTGFSSKKVSLETCGRNPLGSDHSIYVGSHSAQLSLNINHFMNANDKNYVAEGDRLIVTCTPVDPAPSSTWFVLSDGEWNDIENASFTDVEGGKQYVFTAETAEIANNKGLIINQQGYTITQVELIPAPVDIVLNPEDIQGGDIYTALEAKKEGIEIVGNITINLSPDDYSISGSLVAPASITIKGNGATIDASNLSAPFIAMSDAPYESAKVASGQYIIDHITIENLNVNGLTKNFFADKGKSYAYKNFLVNDCVLQYNTQSGVVFNLAGSMAINFDIYYSTFYSNVPGTANFIAMSGKRPWQITGFENETGKLTVSNNTFYNVAKGKQFFNTNTLKGQQYKYVMNSNIFVDVSNKKIYGNMTNNANQVTTNGKNTYMFDGEFFSETNYNGDEGLQTDPIFKDVENGDFAIDEASQQAENMTGDPRWGTWEAPHGIAVTVPAGGYITYFTDEAVSLVENESVKMYTITEVNSTTATATEITFAPENTPFLLYNSGVEDADVMLSFVEANAPVTVAPEFKGTLDGTSLPASDETTDYYICNGTQFVWVKDAGAIAANRCWLEVDAATTGAARTLDIVFNDATGISQVAVEKAAENGAVYNLNGQRVEKARKGLYIINGKKVVVK